MIELLVEFFIDGEVAEREPVYICPSVGMDQDSVDYLMAVMWGHTTPMSESGERGNVEPYYCTELTFDTVRECEASAFNYGSHALRGLHNGAEGPKYDLTVRFVCQSKGIA